MKAKFYLIGSVLQCIIGILAVAAFVVLAVHDEKLIRWIPAVLLAVGCIARGIRGITEYWKNGRKPEK